MEIIWKLVQPARKGGGDKYEAEIEGKQVFQYWPQSVSRDFVTNQPHKKLRSVVEPTE